MDDKKMSQMRAFWDKVKETRIRRGLTMEEVATKLGVTKQAFAYMEKDKLKNVSDELIMKISLILDTDVSELLDTEKYVRILINNYPKELIQWLSGEEAKRYILDAYTTYLKDKMTK